MKKFDWDFEATGATVNVWSGVDSCICGHPRKEHKYDPKDYDRHACPRCECPKFEAALSGRDRTDYPPRLTPTILRYRET